MTRRIISVTLVVLGLVVGALAVASATVWRPTDTETLRLPARPDAALVLTEAGVLDAVADEVTITATADGDEPVAVVIGRSADVTAWVGTDAHTSVTGLAGWEELEVTDVAGQAPAEEEGAEEPDAAAAEEPGDVTALAASDMWVVAQTGTAAVEVTWEHRPGRWSALAATATGPGPELALTWPVEVSTPWLVPGLVVAAVLLLAGLALLTLEVLEARELRRRRAVASARAAETALLPAVPASTGADTGTAGLTRRELRERARAEEAAAARRRGRRPRDEATVPAATSDRGAAHAAGAGPATPTGIAVTAPAGPPAEAASGITEETAAAGRARGAAVVPGSWRTAGPARGAGIVPASPRAEELRSRPAVREEGPAGPTRGAGIVPASPRAARHRGGRRVVRSGSEEEKVTSWRSLRGLSEPDEKGEGR